MNRKRLDAGFAYLVGGTALVSVAALGAIVVFVFAQGLAPFTAPSAPGIRLVAERIDALTVNGTRYEEPAGFIELPRGAAGAVIGFPPEEGAGEERLEFRAEGERLVITGGGGDVEVSSPERYVYMLRWPGMIAALDRRLHVILPEPPYSAGRFLAGLEWRPARDKLFGILPMIAGTLLASLGAILLGAPPAILCAVFMAEFLPARAAAVARAGVELLAGIPSVVYGFFGLMVIVPAVRAAFRLPSGNTLLAAMLVLALMILPTIITIAETALRAVPLSVREASLALGASRMQTAWRVALPHAHSGVTAGVILGVSRAAGETMAVILVAGNSPQLAISPLESARTLTATIAMEMGYASGRHSEMLFSIGAALFVIILALNSLILACRGRPEAA